MTVLWRTSSRAARSTDICAGLSWRLQQASNRSHGSPAMRKGLVSEYTRTECEAAGTDRLPDRNRTVVRMVRRLIAVLHTHHLQVCIWYVKNNRIRIRNHPFYQSLPTMASSVIRDVSLVCIILLTAILPAPATSATTPRPPVATAI